MGKAADFPSLIALIARAEAALAKGGITNAQDRLSILRGIFYGTTWSLDHDVEDSTIRDIGFTIFSGINAPPDPRPLLGPLFNDLKSSAEVTDGRFKLDVGHALIGIESRTSPGAREVTIPTQGGTGLEIVTWLGDLGAAAGILAWRRSASSRARSISVSTVFVPGGSSLGTSANLEGDIAAYIICAPGSTLQAPDSSNSKSVAVLFNEFLPVNAAARRLYMVRSRDFLTMLGGRFRPRRTTLENRSALGVSIGRQIEKFAAAYVIQRFLLRPAATRRRLEKTCRLLSGAANEVATVFVRALEASVHAPRSAVVGRPLWPRPSPEASECNALRAAVLSKEKAKLLEEYFREGRRGASNWLDELVEKVRPLVD